MTTASDYTQPFPLNDGSGLAPLRLGPVARTQTSINGIHDSDTQSAVIRAPEPSVPTKYPRIVVKDPSGRTLDTFTTLQEAIYRANWTRKKLGEWPKTPFEWRLPKAPVPSKPDYSRAGPRPTKLPDTDYGHVHRDGASSPTRDVASIRRRIEMTRNVLAHIPSIEIPVDDVSFIADSLNYLPNLPSFSFLRQSILAGQSTYIQIVASIVLHQKNLQATEHRDPEWEFPGFCTGCKRAGFCYGCSKNPRPHVHEDIPAKIGGGFQFWKRDRPCDIHSWKHPGYWGLPSTDAELRKVIEEYGGLAAYEQAVLRAKREMTRRTMATANDSALEEETTSNFKLQRLKNLGCYPPHLTIVSTEDYRKGPRFQEEEIGGTGLLLEEATRSKKVDEQDDTRLGRPENVSRSLSKESQSSEISVDRTLVRVDTGYFEDITEEDLKHERLKQGELDSKNLTDKVRGKTTVSSRTRSQSRSSPTRSAAGWTISEGGKSGRLKFIDKEKELQEDEEARLRRERANSSVPFGTRRGDVDYKAPKFFTVQKQSRKITMSKDPFSTDRDLNLPKMPKFELKKSEKKTTKFVVFKTRDKGWEAPKKFEVKYEDKKKVKSLGERDDEEDGKNRRKRRDEQGQTATPKRRGEQDISPDSGLDSATTKKDNDREDTPATELDKTDDIQSQEKREEGDVNADELDDDDEKDSEVKEANKETRTKRREIVKKAKPEKSPSISPSPPRLPSPPHQRRETVTSPVPSHTEDLTPSIEEPPLPQIDIQVPAVPELPEIGEKLLKRKEKLKFIVEPPPQLAQAKEDSRKRRAAPKVRVIPKNLYRARRSRPAEAMVTSEELLDINDPLDYLAKWCIINPDRLPFYEIVFESVIADQTPLYEKPVPHDEDQEMVEDTDKKEETNQDENAEIKDKTKKKYKKKKENDKKDYIHELKPSLFPIERGMNVMKSTMTVEEQHLEKLIYTLDLLQDKMVSLGNALEELEAKRIKVLASKAREMFPPIASPNYVPNKKGKKGKKKKKQVTEPPEKLKPHEITDKVIVARLDDKMLNELCSGKDMKLLESEIEILREKIREVQRRVEDLASEKLLTDAFCMNHYFLRQGIHNSLPDDFKRQQSELYNRLHPTPNFEMNLGEVEEALQQINNHLLTKNEFHFLYNILNLPGREKINFRLFTVVAALSEKVTQLDPVIRKMINNFNYNALDSKMEKCKELFDLLEMTHMPKGAAQAESLAVELAAGGLRPEHTRYVLNKFNRESKGAIDFLDFVTYIPLFVEIHKRIIHDPLKSDLDL